MEEMRMKNYELKMENGVITWIECMDADGNPIPGILHIPEDAVGKCVDGDFEFEYN